MTGGGRSWPPPPRDLCVRRAGPIVCRRRHVSYAAAAAAGVSLDGGNLAAATLGMIPLGLLITAFGYLASGWLRTAADTGLLSFVLAAWFFISFIGAKTSPSRPYSAPGIVPAKKP